MPIQVGPAGKVGDGVNAYYVYKVTSDMFSAESLQVDRRYSDFFWLHSQLSNQCAGYIIPPLPAKVVGLLQGPEFLENRRVGLERFLRKVVEHDELRNTNAFKSFLECSPVELTALKSMADKPDLATSPLQRSNSLNSWFGKAYQRMTESDRIKQLYSKAGREMNNANTIEDPEFDQLIKYVLDLHTKVKLFHAKAQAAHKQNKLAAGAYCAMIESINALADTEESQQDIPVSTFGTLLNVLDTRARHIDSEMAMLTASVDDFMRWVGAVVNAVNVREDRRFVYQAKLAAANKANTAETTSSTQSSNVALIKRELQDAKEEFEKVHARVMSEVRRFRNEKAKEIQRMFMSFMQMQQTLQQESQHVVQQSVEILIGNEQAAMSSTKSTTGEASSNQHPSSASSPLLHKQPFIPKKFESLASLTATMQSSFTVDEMEKPQLEELQKLDKRTSESNDCYADVHL